MPATEGPEVAVATRVARLPLPRTGVADDQVDAGLFATWALLDDEPLLVVADRDDELVIRWLNKACAHTFGYAEEELLGAPLTRLVRSPFAPGDQAAAADARLLVDARRAVRNSVTLERRDGSRLRLVAAGVPVTSSTEATWVLRLSVEPDVLRVADDLRASHERFQALADRAPIPIFSSECGVRLGYVNDSFCELHAASAERLLGTEWLSFVHPEDLPAAMEAMQQALGGTPAEQPLRLLLRDGQQRRVHARVVPVRTTSRDAGFIGTLEDVTERRAWEEKLAHQATHDPLTTLPNRRRLLEALDERLDAYRCRREGVALLFLDLDEFKLVNDSFGHDAGDRLLVEVANRLLAVVREDDVVCRFGGDEFAVLCVGIRDEQHAADLAERVLDAVTGPVHVGPTYVPVSASLGVVVAGPQHQVADDLLRDADVAMYQAKAAGKSCVALFDERARTDTQQRLALVGDLGRALESDELEVVYQPVVSVAQAALRRDLTATSGVEALARWTHPQLGAIPPQDFVTLAEQNGLVVALGDLVLRRACRQMVQWREQLGDRAPGYVSVNVSALQLKQGSLIRSVAAALEDSGLEGARLCLELTETVIMHDMGVASDTFEELRALGVRVSIDDFGTGYSSLALLRRLPVDQLKIDRSLLRDLGEAEHDPVVAAVVALASALGLEVVAEGVEDAAQLDELVRLGCPLAQGYLFSVPKGGQELAEDLADAGRRREEQS